MLSLSFSANAAPPKSWEQVRSELPNARSIFKEPEIEIKIAPGIIQVTTAHQIRIKVFTILGRLVSDATLHPGTSQFTVPAHGVYIVTAGELTLKVAV